MKVVKTVGKTAKKASKKTAKSRVNAWPPLSPKTHKNYKYIDGVTFVVDGRKGVTVAIVEFKDDVMISGVARRLPGEKPDTKTAHIVAINDALDQYVAPTALCAVSRCRYC